MTTHPEDLDRTKATLGDVDWRNGPYWDEYQIWRAQNDVPNDSPTIPPFWLRELIRDRFREAAVVIGRTALPDSLPIEQAQQLGKAYEALRNLAEFIDGAHSEARDPLQVAEEVLSVLLGGLDQALTRERSWDGIRAENDATLDEFATFDPEIQRKLIREVVGRAPRA